MNNSTIPGWNFESDSCVINQKNPIWPDQEVGELLWQNGQVIIQSQTQKKQVENNNNHYSSSYFDSRKVHQKNDLVSASNLSQQDEIVSSWIQYPIIDQDPILLEQFSPCDEFEPFNKPIIKQVVDEEGKKFTKFDPRFHHVPNDSSQRINEFCGTKKALKFPHFSAKFNEKVNSSNNNNSNNNNNMSQNDAKECSVMTIGSSHCGSNHILQEQDASKVSTSGVWDNTTTIFSAENEGGGVRDYSAQRTNTVPWSGKGKSCSEMVEPTLTSSSGGSGSTSLAKTCSLSTGNHGFKRKLSDDADELEEQSEATEPNSAIGNKASQRSGSSKRNRSAEVHNLSERRRRDRINEKMRTLQQLIPNSNKTDKASVLEEAVEYMKSLQLQLQIMWMGAGIAPVMFPGIQNYMSQMCMGIAATATPSSLPSTIQHNHHPMQLPRMPPLDHSISVAQAQNKAIMCQNPVLGAFNYQNQMQNPCIAEQYARYMMAYHNLMQSASQQPPMNVFGYGSTNVTQTSQTKIGPSNNSGPINEAVNFDHSMSGKMGSSTF